jgi:hypothetical protein
VVVPPTTVVVLLDDDGASVVVVDEVVVVSLLLRSRSNKINKIKTRSQAITTAAINPLGRRDRRGEDAYTVI